MAIELGLSKNYDFRIRKTRLFDKKTGLSKKKLLQSN